MKRNILKTFSLLLCILLLAAYLPARGYYPASSWSLTTLDGETITNQTYADKTQVLVFYNGKLDENGEAEDENSASFISSMTYTYWIHNEDIQVIAIDVMSDSADDATAFINRYVPDLEGVVFACDDSLVRVFFGYNWYSRCSFVMFSVIKDGENIVNYYGASLVSAIVQYVAPGAWSLPTLDGGMVTDQTYADKTQVLVFYNGTLYENGRPECYNSFSLISDLKNAYWIDNENVQVIAVDAMNDNAEDASAFIDLYASDVDNIVFAYGGGEFMWDILFSVTEGNTATVVFSFCVILQDGEIKTMWHGATSVASITRRLTVFADIGHEPSFEPVSVSGEYRQTEARSMLEMVNGFRTGSDAWYWQNDDTTKTVYDTGELGGLTYDYDLEKIAMQRAMELSILYSHTRPDGTGGTELFVNGTTRSYGENIAMGFENAESVFIAWREDNEPYSGQGHRRNMLRSDFTAIGIGCFYANGILYWVQEFGFSNSGADAVPAQDGSAADTVYCDCSNKYADPYSPRIKVQPTDVSVTEGKTAAFSVTAANADSYQWYYRENSDSAWTAVPPGGTSAVYSLTAEAQYDGYQYMCGVRNSDGIRWTDVVTLTVTIPEILPYTPGDVDENGQVNTTDVILVRRFIAGGYNVEINANAADVDGNGVINTTDVILMRRAIAGGYGVELKPGNMA